MKTPRFKIAPDGDKPGWCLFELHENGWIPCWVTSGPPYPDRQSALKALFEKKRDLRKISGKPLDPERPGRVR